MEGGAARLEKEIVPNLAKLRAPLGVWAVTGNHELYNGLERSVALIEAGGCTVLRDRWASVVPGLVLAGVDDLTVQRQFDAAEDRPLQKAMANPPPGAVILLSHTRGKPRPPPPWAPG